MTSSRFSYVLFIAILLSGTALVLHSCKKRTDNDTVIPQVAPTVARSFTYRSACCVTYAGAPVSFAADTASAATGTSFLWSFGDGTTSTERSPVHTYATGGHFQATLVVNNDHDHPVSDSVRVTSSNTSVYTHNMAGVRNWTVAEDNYIREWGRFTDSREFDSSFALNIVDDGIVRFVDDVDLYIYIIDTVVAKVIAFRDCSGETRSLRYYYLQDSIVYMHNEYVQGGGNSSEYLFAHTK